MIALEVSHEFFRIGREQRAAIANSVRKRVVFPGIILITKRAGAVRQLIRGIIKRKFLEKCAFWEAIKTKYKSGLIEKPLLSNHRGFLNIAYSTRKIKNRQWKIDLTTQWIGSQRIPFTGDNDIEFQLAERSEDYLLLNSQLTRIFGKRLDAYIGVENASNYRQTNPILSSEDPYGEHFDSALIWAPIFGRMVYLGLRFTIKD